MKKIFVPRMLALLWMLLLIACGNASTPVAQPTKAITVKPTVKPTVKSQPTAITPTQNSNVPAVIGSPITAFIARFGQPNEQSTNYLFFTWYQVKGTGDHLVAYTDGNLPHERVNGIVLAATHQAVWTEQDALAHCAPYFPLDAKRGKRYNLIDNDPNVDPAYRQVGYTVVYTSTSLGKVFPASDFTDDKGHEVKPGTFDVMYDYSGPNGTDPDNCSIALGSQNLTF